MSNLFLPELINELSYRDIYNLYMNVSEELPFWQAFFERDYFWLDVARIKNLTVVNYLYRLNSQQLNDFFAGIAKLSYYINEFFERNDMLILRAQLQIIHPEILKIFSNFIDDFGLTTDETGLTVRIIKTWQGNFLLQGDYFNYTTMDSEEFSLFYSMDKMEDFLIFLVLGSNGTIESKNDLILVSLFRDLDKNL